MRQDFQRTVLGLILSAISILMLTLSFPPYNLGMCIWFSFIPMLLAQYRVLPEKLSCLAPALTIGGWMAAFLIPVFGVKSKWFALIPLMIGMMPLLVDRNKRAFHSNTKYKWFVLEGVAGWIGMELIRSQIPAIGTWGFVGYPLWQYPWMLQPVSIFGIYGLDILIMLCNYVLAQYSLSLFDRFMHYDNADILHLHNNHRWMVLLGVLLVGWTSCSLILYANQPTTPTLRLAAVQPNLPKAAHTDTQPTPLQRIALLAQLTRQAAAKGAQVVVWPEMVLGFDPQIQWEQTIREIATSNDIYLIVGYVVAEDNGFRNEAAVLAPSGEFMGVYGKTHPMLTSGEPRTVSAGTYPVFDTPLGRLAVMICFDASFTDVGRHLSRQRAQMIAVPSLFGPSLAELPYTQIIFRAVENRVAIVMSDVAYNSALVDAYGRVRELVITPEGTQSVLVADIPLGTGQTVYAKLGDWLGWLCLLGMVLFAFGMLWQLRRPAI